MAEMPMPGGAPIPNPGPSTAYLADMQREYAAARVATQPTQPMIYLGTTNQPAAVDPVTGAPRPFTSFSEAPKLISIPDAMGQFEQLKLKQKKALARKLALAGLLGSPYQSETLDEFIDRTPLSEVQNAYGELLQAAAARYQAGQKMTPDEILNAHIEYNTAGGGMFEDAATAGGSGSPLAGQTVTTRSRSVDIFSRDDARGLARSVLRRELDRDPTEEEFEDFVAALQTKQKENPTTTTTRTTYDDMGNVASTNSTTRGGMTAAGIEEFATEQAQQNPGWAEWQAIGTYFPGVFPALAAGVPGA